MLANFKNKKTTHNIQQTDALSHYAMRTDLFASRHIGPRESDLNLMYQTIGVADMDQLMYETLPDEIRLKQPLALEPALSEHEYLNHITALGK